jgi:hypothetical protein
MENLEFFLELNKVRVAIQEMEEGFAGMKSHVRKYYLLIYCERKILLTDKKNNLYKIIEQAHSMGAKHASKALFSSELKKNFTHHIKYLDTCM